MGRCAGAPAARVGDREVDGARREELLAIAGGGDTEVGVPAYTEFGAYRRAGGNELLGKVRSGVLPVSDVIDAVEKSGLRGPRRRWLSGRQEMGLR